eukprot:CAMPEP_0179143410 /NCGR_PEP_ID=MMETSP0796-20121207/68988_1 /TAXON_ID=73915 /ORGANISM="Pyrodinium bahamense, Strain pbaha01" /LENGTH=66 /DNA_ID=CAMNT_0020843465 /DNA_START=11 /DNA_END=208 /DNA_ORIENTATION=+
MPVDTTGERLLMRTISEFLGQCECIEADGFSIAAYHIYSGKKEDLEWNDSVGRESFTPLVDGDKFR